MDMQVATAQGQAILTFWIPERIDALLAEYERQQRVSRSECLRAILRQYLYGLFGDPAALPPLVSCGQPQRRGVWGGRLAQFGKNTVEAKLSLPRRWHDDLGALAAQAGITRSHFAREIVAQVLLGHALLPAREPHLESQRSAG